MYLFTNERKICSPCYCSEAGKDPLRKVVTRVERKLKEQSFKFLLLKAYLGLGFFSFLKLVNLLLPPAWHKTLFLSPSDTLDCLCAHPILPKLILALQEINTSCFWGHLWGGRFWSVSLGLSFASGYLGCSYSVAARHIQGKDLLSVPQGNDFSPWAKQKKT